jgi:Protein of unknown function (DUF3616)
MNRSRIRPSLVLSIAGFSLLVSCQREPTVHAPSAKAEPAAVSVVASAPSSSVVAATNQAPAMKTVIFGGACDASGAVPLSDTSLAVADDEDNFLRLYDADVGGEPLRMLNVSPQLALHTKQPESDLEAATHYGTDAYWLTSHGRSRKGKLKPERLFFFGTTVPSLDAPLEFIGEPYRSLQDDLAAEPRLREFELERAARLAPKQPGGLNLEGMSASPDGSVLLGFRSPIPDGLALLVTLHNPRGVLNREKPEFSEPIRLDLGGLGVRGLSWWREHYLVLAGPHADGPTRLFVWAGPGRAASPVPVDLGAFNPEGLFTPEGRDEVLLLSDDGTQLVAGTECKALKDSRNKRFRGVWVRPF